MAEDDSSDEEAAVDAGDMIDDDEEEDEAIVDSDLEADEGEQSTCFQILTDKENIFKF